jgi:N-acetylmuramoyl-L-alanine amidase
VSLALLCTGCGSSGRHRSAARGTQRIAESQRTETTPRSIDPSTFVPGSCVLFPPTAGERGLTVFLDAGHGGIDPGAVGSTQSGQTISEAPLTLAVELDTMRILRHEGFSVVVSRTRDTTVTRLGRGDISGGILTPQASHKDVAARALCADKAQASVLLGIYFDGGGQGSAGCVTGYDAVRPFAPSNLRLAELVQSDVLSAMNAQGWGIPNEGVASDVYLGSAANSEAQAYGHLTLLGPPKRGYLRNPSLMPGALSEPLFVTDPFEGSIAASARGQRVIAGGLATAVQEYFAPTAPNETPRASNVLRRAS